MDMNIDADGDMMTCMFSRAPLTTFETPTDPPEEVTFDLDSESFHILVSSGPLDGDGFITEHERAGLTRDPVDLSVNP